MKLCYFCILVLLLGACTLSSSQEATLHKALTAYVAAHNDGKTMAYVGSTHPNVVGFYEDKGDSIFRQQFELFTPENGGNFLQDGNIKEIEKKGNNIHIHYVFDSFEMQDLTQKVSDVGIIAISNDQGKTWFFAEEADYKNDNIFNKEERLLDL